MAGAKNIVSVVGARPQFVKLAPISHAFSASGKHVHQIVHTGQHYDDQMSSVFFDQLEIPKPQINLEVGSGNHGAQTGAMLEKIETFLVSNNTDAVLVYGDTNSTLAAALAASKMQIPVAHIEAGLRSYNRSMPEEINRIVADRCSDRLYAPTPMAMRILEKENLVDRAMHSGDVMLDAIVRNSKLSEAKSKALESFGLEENGYGIVTIHRPVNTTAEALKTLVAAFDDLAKTLPLIFPVHPRTRAVIDSLHIETGPGLTFANPVSYLDIIQLIKYARIVMTDSGGMQKEAAFLSTPCLTIREETEWTETVEIGVNRLVGADRQELLRAFDSVMAQENMFNADVQKAIRHHYGNGDAANKIVQDCQEWLS